MIREAIGVGETELDALNDAKKQLGLDESDEVEFELIQRAEKKNSVCSAVLLLKLRLFCLNLPRIKRMNF